MTPSETLLRAFPTAYPWPDNDDKRVLAALGEVCGTQLFRLELKRPWLVDDGDRHRVPKKPWPDLWVPTIWVGSGSGHSQNEMPLADAVRWLRETVNTTLHSLGAPLQ